MGGVIVPILEKRRFEFSFLGGGASQSILIQPSIPAFEYYYFQLWVRVHQRDMVSGQNFTFSVFNTLPNCDDASEFTDPTSVLDVPVTNLLPATVPGLVYSEGRTAGPFFRVTLVASQASSPGRFFAQMSAELVLREA